MDLLSFLQTQFFDIVPRIEAPLDGVWRLEFSQSLDFRGLDEVVYMRKPDYPEDPCWEFRGDRASDFIDCRLCSAGRPKPCPGCGRRDFRPCEFDPATGLLVVNGYCYRIEQLDAVLLVLLDTGGLNMGSISRNRYSRIG